MGILQSLATRTAAALFPHRLMTLGGGPMKRMLLLSQTSAKCAFSARKPQPGWIACTSVISAAEMMRGMFR